VIPVRRTIVLVVTPLVAALLVTAFLVVGGALEEISSPVARAPVPVAEQPGCHPAPKCRVAFGRPLEC
jgi:hypothetical protein